MVSYEVHPFCCGLECEEVRYCNFIEQTTVCYQSVQRKRNLVGTRIFKHSLFIDTCRSEIITDILLIGLGSIMRVPGKVRA